MLWALITALILRGQIHKNDSVYPEMAHTPGFYKLEMARLNNYSAAMDKQLKHAMTHHERASDTLFYAAHNGKSRAIQNRAFMRLLASDNRVLHSKKLAAVAKQDLADISATATSVNSIVDTAYDLAYRSKLELLKYRLNQIRAK